MTPQRLRTKLRKIREHGEEMAEEGGELNLVPYLDIVTNVIMFMLATTTFAAALGDVNVTSPTKSGAAAAMEDPQNMPKQGLNLTVNISDKGFTILTSGAVLHEGFSFDKAGLLVDPTQKIPTLPKKPTGEYDFELLAQKMAEIKQVPQANEETKVILNASPNIIYEHVIATMDACRGKLVEKDDPANPGKKLETYERFSDVLLAAGIN